MMTEREELLTSPEYWTTKAQFDLYACVEDYMRSHNMNRTQLAEYLGVSKGYISQLLNGDYDHKLSKLVELSLAFGMAPKIEFLPIEDVINEDHIRYTTPDWSNATYNSVRDTKTIHFSGCDAYEVPSFRPITKVA